MFLNCYSIFDFCLLLSISLFFSSNRKFFSQYFLRNISYDEKKNEFVVYNGIGINARHWDQTANQVWKLDSILFCLSAFCFVRFSDKCTNSVWITVTKSAFSHENLAMSKSVRSFSALFRFNCFKWFGLIWYSILNRHRHRHRHRRRRSIQIAFHVLLIDSNEYNKWIICHCLSNEHAIVTEHRELRPCVFAQKKLRIKKLRCKF